MKRDKERERERKSVNKIRRMKMEDRIEWKERTERERREALRERSERGDGQEGGGEVKQKSTQRMSKDGMLESDVNTWK